MTRVSRERLAVSATAIAFGFGTILAAGRLVPVYFSVDGAHAITDARALLGIAPRPPYYFPAFPGLLIPLDRLGVDPRINVAAVLALSCGALFVALYALGRQVAPPRAAYFAALVAAATTPLGELLGWQGGTTLLALVAITASFALFLQWRRSPRWTLALAVGLSCSVALGSHPFIAAFGAFVLVGLWFDAIRHGGRPSLRGLGPDGLVGQAIAAAPLLLTAAYIAVNYLAVEVPTGSGLRLPDPGAPIAIFEWAVREGPALALFTTTLLVVAVIRSGRGRTIAWMTVAAFVLVPAILAGDSSYQSRVVYLLAPALCVGAAGLWIEVERRIHPWEWSASRSGAVALILTPLLFAVLAASLGYPQRVSIAVPYYSNLSAADYALIENLAGQPGAVATSWSGNRYWNGLLNAWYVEGIANRAAIGPTDPALTTRSAERAAADDAWRLFSGTAGFENGSVQLAFGPPDWRADPAIAGRIGGSYLPLVFMADASNSYGVAKNEAALTWEVGTTEAEAVKGDAEGKPLAALSATLSGSRVSVSWARDPAAAASPWTIWVWPAFGLPWRHVAATPTTVDMSPFSYEAYRDPASFDAAQIGMTLTVSGGATLEYVDDEPRYRDQAVAIHVPPDADLVLTVDVLGTDAARATTRFDEQALIRTRSVSAALVWDDSGWRGRFDASPCFAASRSGKALQAFDVIDGCPGLTP